MKIKINSLHVRNFLSVGNKWIIINYEQGLFKVSGENLDNNTRNGCGKSSTIVDALMFGLFGKPVRKVNLDSLINKTNNKGCEIKVDFNVENKRFLIHRGIKPSFLKLYEDYEEGKENIEIEDSAKKYTQKRIDTILSANFNTFNQLLIMTSAYTTPFLDMDSTKKREVIEDLLGVSVFGEMSDLAKDKFLENKNSLALSSKEFEITSNSLKALKETNEALLIKSDEFKESKKNKLNIIKKKLIKNIADIKEVTSEIEEMQKMLDVSMLQENKLQLENKISEVTVNIRTLKNKITDNDEILLQLKDTPTCPLCKTNTNSEHVASHVINLDKEVISSKSKLEKLKVCKLELQDKLDSVVTKLDEVTTKSKQVYKLENKLAMLLEDKANLKERALEIKEEKNNFVELINEKEVEIKSKLLATLELNINSTSEEKTYYDYIRKMLSNEGVKNYIISKILTFWNKKVNFYLSKLNAEFSIKFDDKLDATLKSRSSDSLTYHSFSGGEKARIDVAILLSIIDISKLQNSIDLNVMVVDEVLDGGLDDNGREEVLYLLKHMCTSEGKSIYVISHNMNLPSEVFDKEILLQKKNGFTSLI